MIENSFGVLLSAFVFFSVMVTAFSIGVFVITRFPAIDCSLRTLCFSIVMGLGLLGTVLGWLSVFRLLLPHTILPLWGGLALLTMKSSFSFCREYVAKANLPNRFWFPLSGIDLVLVGWIAIVLLLYLVGNLAPPTGGDPLWHNLAMPKFIALQATFLDLWQSGLGAEHTETPKLVDHLYALGMILRSDTISTLFNFLFLFILLAMVFEFTYNQGNLRFSLWSVLIVALMPVVTYLGRESKLDLGLAVFELSAIYCFYLFKKNYHTQWLVLASTFAGFALGVRYNALALALTLTLFLGYGLVTHRPSGMRWRSCLAAWVFPGALVAALWYCANLVRYGNPLFPFFDSSLRGLFSKLAFPAANHWETLWEVSGSPVESLTQFRLPMDGLLGWLYPFWYFSFNQASPVNNWSEMWGPLVLSAFPFIALTRWHHVIWVRWALIYVGVVYLIWVNQLHITRTFVAPLTILNIIAVGAFLKAPRVYSRLLQCMMLFLGCWSSLVLFRSTYGCIPFALGLESRSAFLQRELSRVPIFPSYKLVAMSNTLPASSKVLLRGTPSGYYMKRYTCGLSQPVSSPEEFLAALRADNITHVYFNSFAGFGARPSEPADDPLLSPLINQQLQCISVDTVRVPHPIAADTSTGPPPEISEWKQYLFRLSDL